jgi:hypothetical protein
MDRRIEHVTEDATTLELWSRFRAEAARQLDNEAEELDAGGGAGIFNDHDKDIAAQTYRNAATKIRNMASPGAEA